MRPIRLEAIHHSAPECDEYGDLEAVRRFEREVRVHRSYTEPFTVTPLEERVDGSYRVESGSGASYIVDLVDASRLHDTCTCPDFLSNELGACKHLEATLRAVAARRQLKTAYARLPQEPEAPVLTVDASAPLRLTPHGPWSAAQRTKYADVLRTDPQATIDVGRSPSGVRVVHAAKSALQFLISQDRLGHDQEELSQAVAAACIDPDVLRRPLFSYQRVGVMHLVNRSRALLADDMGLGKTVQAIAACEVLRRMGKAHRIVIVTVASLKHQWAQEIQRYSGAQALVIAGNAAERRRQLESPSDYTILNYEQTFRDLTPLKTIRADVLILDEAQRAKNFRSKTAATLRSIPSRSLFILTGTPVENRLDDLYSLMQLINPAVFGPLWRFNLEFHEQNERGRIVGYKNLAALRQRVAPWVLRRRKEDVLLDLPPRMEQTRHIPLTPEQADLEAAYRQDAAQMLAIAERRPLRKEEHEKLMMLLLKARQACNAIELCDGKSTRPASPKLDELEALLSEIVADGSSKVIVFSEWVKMLELAAARLRGLGIGYEMLYGGVPTANRPALLDRFREDASVRVLLSTDAGGVGLNLQAATYVIHLDLPWNPARLDQRSGRAHRLGQTRGVLITYLCAETGIERGIEGALHGKRAVRSAALDPDAEVDRLEAPSFMAFVKQVQQVLEDATEPPSDSVDPTSVPPTEAAFDASEDDAVRSPALEAGAGRDVAPEAEGNRIDAIPQAVGAAPEASMQPADRCAESAQPSTEKASEAEHSTPPATPTETRARGRLRLSKLVLQAGFLADALRGAYEALFAAIAGLSAGVPPDGHAALVALAYRELLPSGRLPAAAPAAIAKLHDLTTLERYGVPVDSRLAEEAVAEAEHWVQVIERGP